MFVWPVQASMNCVLTATPLQVSSEGLAEPVGEILITCSQGAPGGAVQGALQVFLSAPIANRLTSGRILQGVTAQINTGSTYVPLPVSAELSNDSVAFQNLQFNLSAEGAFQLKIAGIRAQASAVTNSLVLFSGNQQLLFPTPNVVVASGAPTLLASNTAAAIVACQPTPAGVDFPSMLALNVPMSTTRVTEAWAAAFSPKQVGADTGVRLLIRFDGVPAAARIFAPDGVAGSDATQPTLSGQMGGSATPGVYTSGGARSLLLSRVQGAAPDGAGGVAVFTPSAGTNVLTAIGESDRKDESIYLVYEVLDADPSVVETAQIPVWIWLPPDWQGQPTVSVVRQTVQLAPVSEVTGASYSAPVPRYQPAAPPVDCQAIGDCAAPYWPHLQVYAVSPTTFTAPAGGYNRAGYVNIHNTGGGILEWHAVPRHKTGSGWVTITPDTDFNNSNIRFDLLPQKLAPGQYDAELVFQQVNSPTGAVEEQIIPVSLTVTEAAPPPAPPPVVSDVINPAMGWATPTAPGALLTIKGSNFAETSQVTIGGVPAQVLAAMPIELQVVVPLNVPMAVYSQLIVWNGSSGSFPWVVELRPVWPSTTAFRNGDGSLNSPDSPVVAGQEVQVYFTGAALSAQPLTIKIHDQFLQVQSTPSAQPGVDVVRFSVPAFFPTMETAVLVCAQAANGESAACSYPRSVWIKSASE
jgi:hypothetical protein